MSGFHEFMAKRSRYLDASLLQAYERAGSDVYELVTRLCPDLESTDEITLMTPDVASDTSRALAWNCFALQTLGDSFAKRACFYEGQPVSTAHPLLMEQALLYYAEVATWLRRAQGGNKDILKEVSLPAVLPPAVASSTSSQGWTHALRDGVSSLRVALEAHCARIEKTKALPPSIKAKLLSAHSAFEYADKMWQTNLSNELLRKVSSQYLEIAQDYYELGQAVYLPILASKLGTAHLNGPLLPSDVGFDPWKLTAVSAYRKFAHNAEALLEIKAMWKADKDPRATLELAEEINNLHHGGKVEIFSDVHHWRAPWSSIFLSKSNVSLGLTRIKKGDQFTLSLNSVTKKFGIEVDEFVAVPPEFTSLSLPARKSA